MARNAVIVGPRGALGRSSLIARDVNWINGLPASPLRAEVKIRYKARALPATITPLAGLQVRVDFDAFIDAITAGQGAVFYQADHCLGGGLIADGDGVAAAAPANAGAETIPPATIEVRS